MNKLSGKGFSLLPERDVHILPWREVVMDLIGSWAVQLYDTWHEFNTLPSIDTVITLVELIRVDRKTSAYTRSKWEQSWLARYPWPK